MIHRHESSPSDPFERGREFGATLAAAVENTVASYQRLFHEVHGLSREELARRGATVGAAIASGSPDAEREIRGIAAGAGVDPLLLLAINARTEILAGAGPAECSVLGTTVQPVGQDAGGPVLAQNWDWHPFATDSLVLWTIHDAGGRWFTTLTEAGILGKIGVNSSGLGVCLNILAGTDDGGLADLPIHIVLRLILAECTSVAEAQRLVEAQRYSASTAITVASEDGQWRTFEVSPRGVGVLCGHPDGICHTNHFLTDTGSAVDTIARDGVGSVARFEQVSSAVGAKALTVEAIKQLLRSHAGGTSSVCNHDLDNPVWADKQQTMASVIIGLRERTIAVSDGPPCGAAYVQYDAA